MITSVVLSFTKIFICGFQRFSSVIFLFESLAYDHIRNTFTALFQGCTHTVASPINSSNPILLAHIGGGEGYRRTFSHFHW